MKKRVFVAIDISDFARLKASEYIESLQKESSNVRVNWEKSAKLHLTLKFLGDINDEQLDKLIDAAERTAREISSFKMRIEGTGVFPSPKNARILWLGLKDEQGSLRKLNEILEKECEREGFEREKRNFKAHLTIGRLKEKSDELVKRHLQTDFEPVEFEASEIVIYQSVLQPTGSIYSVISRHKFKAK